MAKNSEEAIKEIEEKIGAPNNFFFRLILIKEDDWSFIIKIHALLEAIATFMLTRTLKRPRLQDIFARIELSNSTSGKLKFLKELNLLSKKQRNFIRQISEVRNSFIHDVSNVGTSLQNHIDLLSKEKKRNFYSAIAVELDEIDLEDGKKYSPIEYAIINPKYSIWFSTLGVLLTAYFNNEEIKLFEEKNLLSQLLRSQK